MVNFNSQPSVRLKCMVAIQFRARVKPRFQSTSKATVCIFDTVALLFEAHTQPQPHFLLPRVSGNNWWWMTSIRKQMIQKRKKSLNNCRYHTMSGIPTGLHVRHSLHIQNLSRGVYILHILNRWTVLTFFNLNHSCSYFICVCGFFSFCDRISILSSHST